MYWDPSITSLHDSFPYCGFFSNINHSYYTCCLLHILVSVLFFRFTVLIKFSVVCFQESFIFDK